MEKKLIDIVALGLYNEKIKGLLAEKQDKGEFDAAGAAAQALADAKAYADAEIEKLSFDEAGTAKTLADAAEKNAKDYADGLAVNYDAAGAADAAEKNAKDYADGKFQEKGNFETAGAAEQALTDAKDYADGLVKNEDGSVKFDAAGAAAQALTDAKADAATLYQVKGDYEVAGTAAGLNEAMDARMQAVEGREVFVSATVNQAIADAKAAAIADAAEKYQVKGNYEVAGAAAEALDAAKEYADGKFQVAGNYEVAGAATQALTDAKAYADGLNTAMDARVVVLEEIDHDKLASDAAASAVATILDDAPEKFDTLKEVADWIANNESAASAADLVTRVAALEAIEHDAYVAADEAVLADAKAYADAAEKNAKDYADGKFQVKGNYEEAGAADAALTDAKAYTDTEVAKKQNIIDDLATIRLGAAAGATALQESDLQFAVAADIDALFA